MNWWILIVAIVKWQNIANTYAEVCPRGITLTNTSGVIKSPSYPSPYPDNQNCSWNITAREGNRVKLVIRAHLFAIQHCGSQNNCSCDYLQVQNGFSADWNGNEKICGFPNKNITYYSTRDSLKVVFLSDNTKPKEYDGFEASYTQLKYSPSICPTEAIPLHGNGTLSSPNYPVSNYPASRSCSWIVTVPSDKKVKFAFTEFALGSCERQACSSGNCSYVELYDGASPRSPLLRRFCNGSVKQDVFFSRGNKMFVRFRSGSSLDRGFEAQYSVSSGRPTTTTTTTPSQTVTTVTASTSASSEVPYEVDSNKIGTNQVLIKLAKKEFLSNGNQTRYIQIIVIQLKDEDQDIGNSTNEKYSARNIDKDYETKEKGQAYISAEFDYGKTEFSVGDEKHYSRSKEGLRKYLNGKLESNTHYAVFQRSFDDYGSYDSERFIFFKTKKSSPLVTVAHVVLVVIGVAILAGIAVHFFKFIKKSRRYIPDVSYVSRDSHAAYQNAYCQETADEIQGPVDVVICNPNYD